MSRVERRYTTWSGVEGQVRQPSDKEMQSAREAWTRREYERDVQKNMANGEFYKIKP